MNWQPIETAPKNAPVLAHSTNWVGAPMIVEWDETFSQWFEYGTGDGIRPQPTHWMELPEPPK